MQRYVGRKDSEIDETVANYLRDFPEQSKVKIMFLRESEGVYKFGQRRVYIKVEKGKAI